MGLLELEDNSFTHRPNSICFMILVFLLKVYFAICTFIIFLILGAFVCLAVFTTIVATFAMENKSFKEHLNEIDKHDFREEVAVLPLLVIALIVILTLILPIIEVIVGWKSISPVKLRYLYAFMKLQLFYLILNAFIAITSGNPSVITILSAFGSRHVILTLISCGIISEVKKCYHQRL